MLFGIVAKLSSKRMGQLDCRILLGEMGKTMGRAEAFCVFFTTGVTVTIVPCLG